ncbi:MAG TPA: DUF2474 family protein [Ferrovibrio sp.]|uniref:DUF2474 family protein n=1 Tax=Ferrovibrio sp. TaxID=1917215 RepID=UPI002ED63242
MPTGSSAARWSAMPAITDRRPLWQRLMWFAVLWAGGVAAVGAVSLLIRLVLKP